MPDPFGPAAAPSFPPAGSVRDTAISAPGFHAAPGSPIRGQLLVRRTDHATAPIGDGFDWAAYLADAGTGPWYLVVFRSIRRAGADTDLLTEFDDLAHIEARLSGGLHCYFKGIPDERGACLSMCLWDSQEQARAALRLPRHHDAARLAGVMYASFRLERYQVSRDPTSGTVRFRPV
jgi:hypothetical protein